MVDYGAGPVLDSNFDFVVDSSGDIATDDGLAELEKDLALLVSEAVREAGLGRVFDSGDVQDLRITVSGAIRQDPRISEVREIDINTDEQTVGEINITVVTGTTDGPFDLVIPVN